MSEGDISSFIEAIVHFIDSLFPFQVTFSYLALFFTEARPFGPMMVKIIQRLFINMTLNCLLNIKIQR